MKQSIVIINGSPRKKGATARLLGRMKELLDTKKEIEVIYFDLADIRPAYCSGCMNCYQTGRCHLKDELETVNKAVSTASGIIIGSPVYVSNIPSLLKTYIDRGHFVLEQSLRGKQTFAVCTYEIGGNRDVIGILNKLFRIAGGNIVGNIQLKLDFNTDPLADKKVEKLLIRKTDILYKAIRKQQQPAWWDKIFNSIAINTVIKPYVLKKPLRYKAVLTNWEKLNIR